MAIWIAPSWIVAERFVEAVEAGNPVRALDYADTDALRRDVADDLDARIPDDLGAGAATFLQAMAADMTTAWGDREALAAWLRLRGSRAATFDPVLQPLGTPHRTAGAGWSRARLGYEGGVSFDLAFEAWEPRWVGVDFGS